ncbi:RNA-directed DNA polymerase from mobile element jockey [Trichonephila clavipes]|nr:RNA-directed DNA polymerase from mobile element jockey [Trichonephila clavipes]
MGTSILFTDDSRFSLSSDSHRILIWRERGSRNHPSNIIERDRHGVRGVLVWGGIMLGSRTDLHIFDAGSVNGTHYCNEILLPYVRLFRGAMGLQFLFMDDNAPCHPTVAAEQLLESRRLAARTLPPVTIRELRLALQDEWAAMPQQLIDTLILSMGRRCETCLAVREIISPTKDRMFLAGHPSQGCFGLQSHCAPCYFFNQASFYPSDFSFINWQRKLSLPDSTTSSRGKTSFTPEQHGFRPRLSTSHQLLRVIEYIKDGIDRNQYTAAVFLDIQKAFDRVWHTGLFKLITYKIPPPLILLLKSYINDISFTIKINRTYSQIKSSKAGIAQGSILGPVLFNLYVNDIIKSTNTMICMYADDTAILSRHYDPNTLTKNLNDHLAHLEIWFSVWKIALNTSKTEAVSFTQKRPPPEITLQNQRPTP